MSSKAKHPEIVRLGDLPKNVYQRVAALPREVAAGGREAWLTGLGAVAVAEKEGSRLLETIAGTQQELSKKGAQLEKRGKARLEATREELAELRTYAVTRASAAVTNPVTALLQRIGVPTRDEVHELSTKVDLLTRKLNTLIKALDKASEPALVEQA